MSKHPKLVEETFTMTTDAVWQTVVELCETVKKVSIIRSSVNKYSETFENIKMIDQTNLTLAGLHAY